MQKRRLRSSLNNSEINSFVNDSNNDVNRLHVEGGAKADRRMTDKTMLNTPNMEKRQLGNREDHKSVSSEEDKDASPQVIFVNPKHTKMSNLIFNSRML